jgi:hypothetical protein
MVIQCEGLNVSDVDGISVGVKGGIIWWGALRWTPPYPTLKS